MFARKLTVAETIEAEAGEETIRFVVIGDGWRDKDTSFFGAPRNVALPYAEARCFLTSLLTNDAPGIVAWTDTKVITTKEYDGRMSTLSLPRSPSDCEARHA